MTKRAVRAMIAATSMVAVADVNGDGRPNLVVANEDQSVVAVLLGDGRGHFATALSFPAGDQPFSLAVGDFNADRRPDLAAANRFSGSVSVLLNNLPPTVSVAAGGSCGADDRSGTLRLIVGDDGPVDAVTLTASSSNPTLLPTANVIFAGSGASRTVTITTALRRSGLAVLTLTTSDGLATSTKTITVRVGGRADTPSLVPTVRTCCSADSAMTPSPGVATTTCSAAAPAMTPSAAGRAPTPWSAETVTTPSPAGQVLICSAAAPAPTRSPTSIHAKGTASTPPPPELAGQVQMRRGDAEDRRSAEQIFCELRAQLSRPSCHLSYEVGEVGRHIGKPVVPAGRRRLAVTRQIHQPPLVTTQTPLQHRLKPLAPTRPTMQQDQRHAFTNTVIADAPPLKLRELSHTDNDLDARLSMVIRGGPLVGLGEPDPTP